MSRGVWGGLGEQLEQTWKVRLFSAVWKDLGLSELEAWLQQTKGINKLNIDIIYSDAMTWL